MWTAGQIFSVILRVGTLVRLNSCCCLFFFLLNRTTMNHKKGRYPFLCQSFQLRMSGFYYWMCKPRCLVFPFHWLRGQAGLCLAPTHLPSRLSCEGRCRAMRCLFEETLWNPVSLLFWPLSLCGGAWELDLSLPTDSSLSDSPFCSLFIHRALWKIQPEFLETRGPLALLSPVLFSRWSTVGPTRGPFSTSSCAVYRTTSSVLSQWKEPNVFAFWV